MLYITRGRAVASASPEKYASCSAAPQRVVAGRRGEHGRAAVVRVGGDLGDGLLVVVREDAGDDGHARGNRPGDGVHDREPLVKAEAVAFAGQPSGLRGHAPAGQPLDQLPQRSVVDLALGVDRGEQGDDDTLKGWHSVVLRSVTGGLGVPCTCCQVR